MLSNFLKNSIRTVQDFPKPGIQFKDITTALKDAQTLHMIVDDLYEYYKNKGITKVVGVESRGFVVGSILAYRLNAGFVLIRKSGKLPADTFKIEYDLEYGSDCLEIHKDSIAENDVILLHDDLLATGGSANAALNLLSNFKTKGVYVNFLIELAFLGGREKINKCDDIHALVSYE